jgi:hypothetical protein
MDQLQLGGPAAERHKPVRRRRFVAIGALVLALGSIAAHIELLGRRLDYRGFLLPLDHLFALLVASVLFLLCTAVGRKALRAFSVTVDDPIEGIPYAVAIGAVAIGTLLLFAGAAGLLHRWSLALIFTAISAACWSERAAVRLWLTHITSSLRAHGLSSAGLALQALVLLFALMLALRPPSDWDALMYHLDVPADYLAAGRVYLPVDNLHAALIGPIQLLYIPLLALATPSAAAVFNVMCAVALAMAILAHASRFFSREAGGVASVAIWGNTTLVLVAGTPRIDTTLCLFTFLGQCALLRALYEPSGRRYYVLAAVLLGAAIGVKLQALAYVLAMLPLVAWVAIKQGRINLPSKAFTRRVFIAVGSFAAAGLLVSLPWLVRNQWMTGAPFYPLLAVARLPPWLAGLFGSSQVPVSVDPYSYDWIGLMRAPFHLFDAFVSPGRLTIEPEGRLYFFSPLLLLLPLWLIRARNGAANWLAWGGIAYLLIVLVPFVRTNLRYLLPAVAPLTLVSAHGLVIALRLVPYRQLIQRSLVAIALIPTAVAALVWGMGTYAAGHVLGTRSESDYLSMFSEGSVHELHTLLHRMPSSGRVLFLFEARGYGTDREVLQDNAGSNWPFLVEARANEHCLAGTGITHVLVNSAALNLYLSRGLDTSRLRWSAFGEFEKHCLEQIGRTDNFWLYRVLS